MLTLRFFLPFYFRNLKVGQMVGICSISVFDKFYG